ncbi:hypothetical protein BJ165DRAFT_1407850 [Panaeolus papilionaceus]|nr:hypothetical protein BJ165DRAFT_1407850 [Panaeolus papilionaceus]
MLPPFPTTQLKDHVRTAPARDCKCCPDLEYEARRHNRPTPNKKLAQPKANKEIAHKGCAGGPKNPYPTATCCPVPSELVDDLAKTLYYKNTPPPAPNWEQIQTGVQRTATTNLQAAKDKAQPYAKPNCADPLLPEDQEGHPPLLLSKQPKKKIFPSSQGPQGSQNHKQLPNPLPTLEFQPEPAVPAHTPHPAPAPILNNIDMSEQSPTKPQQLQRPQTPETPLPQYQDHTFKELYNLYSSKQANAAESSRTETACMESEIQQETHPHPVQKTLASSLLFPSMGASPFTTGFSSSQSPFLDIPDHLHTVVINTKHLYLAVNHETSTTWNTVATPQIVAVIKGVRPSVSRYNDTRIIQEMICLKFGDDHPAFCFEDETGQAKVKPTMNCGECKGIDHVASRCPLKQIPGWPSQSADRSGCPQNTRNNPCNKNTAFCGGPANGHSTFSPSGPGDFAPLQQRPNPTGGFRKFQGWDHKDALCALEVSRVLSVAIGSKLEVRGGICENWLLSARVLLRRPVCASYISCNYQE